MPMRLRHDANYYVGCIEKVITLSVKVGFVCTAVFVGNGYKSFGRREGGGWIERGVGSLGWR